MYISINLARTTRNHILQLKIDQLRFCCMTVVFLDMCLPYIIEQIQLSRTTRNQRLPLETNRIRFCCMTVAFWDMCLLMLADVFVEVDSTYFICLTIRDNIIYLWFVVGFVVFCFPWRHPRGCWPGAPPSCIHVDAGKGALSGRPSRDG